MGVSPQVLWLQCRMHRWDLETSLWAGPPFPPPAISMPPCGGRYNPALVAWLSAVSCAHLCHSPARIASVIILLLLDFVSLLWNKSQAETPSEGIWTISALYLGTETLYACNKKHYLLLPPNKMIPLIFKFQDHTLCL